MRVQHSISPTKKPLIVQGWVDLWQRAQGIAARVRLVWSSVLDKLWTRVRDRRGWARFCLAAGVVLALVALGGWGYRVQLLQKMDRGLQRWLGRDPHAALVDEPRPGNALPALYLELEPSAYQALSMQQQKARRAGILWPQDAQPVAAALTIEGEVTALQRALDRRPARQLEVQVRLAGSRCDGVHPVDQWRPSKWALEIQTAPSVSIRDVSFLGADAFTLSSPALRGYLDGWLYSETLYRAGLLPARARLVNLVLNKEDWGLYLLEPDLEPEGTAWFESLDGEQQGRLLAHADLWGRETPGACPSAADAPARRVLAVDPRARAAYKSEAARITRREYVDALRAVYRRSFERGRRALADEFFSVYLGEPWDVLMERQAELSARAAGLAWEDADARPLTGNAWQMLPSAKTTVPSSLAPAVLPSIEDVLARHPFLVRSDRPGFLGVKPGDWMVEGDLVLPLGVGLLSSEAFTLRFERGAMLIAHGPLLLHGQKEAGIRLLPQGDHWAGVRVLRADPATPSAWRYVEVRGVRGVPEESGSTGGKAGILFYESPISLDRCRVMDGYAAAAFAILRAPFEIQESEFGAASGDLVQAHAAPGTISRSAFHDALGAAVRAEQSTVEIVDVSVQRVQGEALLAGPESRVAVRGLRAARVGVGVASVGAWARVRDARVGGASTAGFVAYAKADLDLGSIVFEDDSVQALIQEGSEAALDGVLIETQSFAPEELRPPVEPSPAMSPLGVRFGPSIWLVGYELTTPERAPGETIEVILYWRAFAYLDRQYTIFMHVRDAAGETVAGWDMMPRYNTFPTTDWPLVERIDDAHIVPLSTDLPPGEYTVALGMYDWATGVRLPAYSRSGESLPEATVLLEERVTVK